MFSKRFWILPIIIIFSLTLTACSGTQAAINETWTLVELITKGERTETATETVEVRNCGFEESKSTSCSAGTSNDLSVSLGGGLEFGEGIQGSVDASVIAGLGIGRESGEILNLPSPPNGSIYVYKILKVYRVIAGEALARSSSGKEQNAAYLYHASCSITIETRNISDCSSDNPAPTIKPTDINQSDMEQHLQRDEIDSLFGVNNWFCFPDRDSVLGVKRLPPNFTIKSPLRYIDTWVGRYEIGETSPGSVGATAELNDRLPRDECPSFQKDPLISWDSARSSDVSPLSKDRLDALVGKDNWECLTDYTFGIKVNYLENPIYVGYPFTAIDMEDSTRYGIGETAPGGGRATIWFAAPVSIDQCP